MDGNSYNTQQEVFELLKTMCPEAFTEGKIDVKKLRRSLGEEVSEEVERYGLNWAGKSICFRHIQESTTATLIPCKTDGVDFDTTENLFIEGDNLQILKVLQKSYYNKIKLIYIDPPYNTGNDSFIYTDRFAESKEDYLQRIGDKDAEGNLIKDGFWRKNSKDSGHFHSNWLSMMYPRLFLARNLLRDDGLIFVSIDDNEIHNLRMIMNEIFGEENCLDRGCLVWINKGSTKGFRKIVKNHEYILAYGRNAEIVKSCFGKNFPNKLNDLEHYCFNRPNPGNPICEIKFKAGCKIKGVKDAVFENVVGDEVKLEIVTEKMTFKNSELVDDVILKGAFPYRFQIEEFFRNQDDGKPTFDKQGQEWVEIYFNSKGMPRYRKSRANLIISSVIDEEDIPNYGADDIKTIFHSHPTANQI
ncbi:MAG: site-specific DNA-methyltransferase [Planctomycetes bacterium]|nr:site-specific DNA-methyltransferase [Planctomycetota bacterium]MBL7144020.1 site-specific DNA-methyltransferase [Phycisphaerae bacterium]